MEKRNVAETAQPIVLRTAAAEHEENVVAANENQVETQGYSLRRFLLGSTAVIGIALVAWPFLPRTYESTATLVLRPTDLQGQTDYAQTMRQPLDESFILSDLDAFNSVALADTVIKANNLSSDAEFDATPGIGARIAAWFHHGRAGVISPETTQEITQAKLRENLEDKMVVHRNRQSYTVNVGFHSKSPEKAAMLATSLVNAYLQAQVERKMESVEALTRLLQDRVETAKKRSDASTAALQDFMSQSGLIDQGDEISLQAQLGTLSTELATAQARVIDAGTRATTLASMKANGTLDSAPEVLQSPTIQRLNQSLTESMSRLAVMSTESINIAHQAEAERNRIADSVRIEADNWKQREQLLQGAIEKIRQAMVERRRASLHMDTLRREADNDVQVLADAQTRLKAQAPAMDALKPDAEILSPATVPGQPIFPTLPLYLIGTLGAACLVGAAMNATAIQRDVTRLLRA